MPPFKIVMFGLLIAAPAFAKFTNQTPRTPNNVVLSKARD
jgi:hypothetical protein